MCFPVHQWGAGSRGGCWWNKQMHFPSTGEQFVPNGRPCTSRMKNSILDEVEGKRMLLLKGWINVLRFPGWRSVSIFVHVNSNSRWLGLIGHAGWNGVAFTFFIQVCVLIQVCVFIQVFSMVLVNPSHLKFI